MKNTLKCGRFDLDAGSGAPPLVMGILNITPDSFSDGGQFASLEAAVSQAEQMLAAGVDIIDIGGESSRPGAPAVSVETELARVMPVLYALRDCGKPLSVDTWKPEVMRQALAAGADMINDIRGFQEEGALAVVRESDCGLCIMHMQNLPRTMQAAPQYTDVVAEVIQFLRQRADTLVAGGVDRARLSIDPGFGFGKTLAHNLALIQNLQRIADIVGLPLLAGVSRKSMIGEITGQPQGRRMAGSVAAALACAVNGARLLRVHDVAETIDALAVWRALAPGALSDQQEKQGA